MVNSATIFTEALEFQFYLFIQIQLILSSLSRDKLTTETILDDGI